jgi:hypothetical protein
MTSHTSSTGTVETVALTTALPRTHNNTARGIFTMKLSDLSPEELKTLVVAMVDDRLRELLGDPDMGLELVDSVKARLKESLLSTERLTGEDVAAKLGLRW